MSIICIIPLIGVYMVKWNWHIEIPKKVSRRDTWTFRECRSGIKYRQLRGKYHKRYSAKWKNVRIRI